MTSFDAQTTSIGRYGGPKRLHTGFPIDGGELVYGKGSQKEQ